MTPFSAVGLELWSMTSDIFFDNFMITDDRNTADRWANDGWGLKKSAESAAEVSSRLPPGEALKGCSIGTRKLIFKDKIQLSHPRLAQTSSKDGSR